LSHSAVVYSDTSRTAVYTPSLLGALPISCETISLQLLTHRQRVRLHPVGASAGGRDALGYSQQRLHMMSDLVRDDVCLGEIARRDRKSTRLNSSHVKISYAVFCWKKTKTL